MQRNQTAVTGITCRFQGRFIPECANSMRIHDKGPAHGNGVGHTLIEDRLHLIAFSHPTDEDEGNRQSLPRLTTFLTIIRTGGITADVMQKFLLKSLANLDRIHTIRLQCPGRIDAFCKGFPLRVVVFQTKLKQDGKIGPDRLSHRPAYVTDKPEPIFR